ncbi:FMN reductase [Micromonospora pallida]|uniref:FMN reductase n=1 Tax=Micromonospora pallida TaxID=145854 RepID=A0A1C6SFN7_9ACTN|nr:NAD(P)H-dependent oxidoreductase [Micromonospora pallida]SCL28158.1 FMN reductase [Micromonospora pallida]
MRITVLVGNPKPGSRTLAVGAALAERLAALAGGAEVLVVDLADVSDRLFRWPDDELAALGRTVASSDLLVVASPTYKATYTGLLKAFLDRYGEAALTGVPTIPVMTAGSDRHALASDVHLRPLLVELGACVPTPGFFLPMADLERLDQVLDTWLAVNARPVQLLLAGLRPQPAVE